LRCYTKQRRSSAAKSKGSPALGYLQ